MSWQQSGVYTANVPEGDETEEVSENDDFHIRFRFTQFLKTFEIQNNLVYRDQLQDCLKTPAPAIELNLDHLSAYDSSLCQLLRVDPERILKLFEEASFELAKVLFGEDDSEVTPIQVTLVSSEKPSSIRVVNSTMVSKLVVVSGIALSASTVTAKPIEITAICTGCHHILHVPCGLNPPVLPTKCQRPSEKEGGPISVGGSCPNNPYVILPDQSKFSDFQFLKFQESPEGIPPGEIPRHISAAVDRALANRVIPGKRYTAIGIYSITHERKSVQKPYLKIVGLMDNTEKVQYEEEDTEPFHTVEEVEALIAPEIYGMEQVKRAIAAQLFGGVPRDLPDRMRIRGDINVLLLGDPSVAKSQFLKFVHRVAPISVYTSGKGSSAAGLTASVIRQPGTGQFYLEGGAMVLADGGIVCIDEFDKMRIEDRVAIHEAMEQQTISIAKAGITAVLSTRTAVLAAANPIQGRYDDLKTARENVDFQTTILSRFDLIFVLKDRRNQEYDKKIAEHVLSLHTRMNNKQSKAVDDSVRLRNYIARQRANCHPQLTEAAAETLKAAYVEMRSQINSKESLPITVRQLEAIIRISEAFAKMENSEEARESHLEKAIQLFKVSTLDAAASGITAPGRIENEEQRKQIESVRRYINRRCPQGTRTQVKSLMTELSRSGFSETAAVYVIQNMLYGEEFQYQNERRVLYRATVKSE